MEESTLQSAVFGGGCFWCGEALFERLRGVESVVSGYAGGAKENPTYKEVSSGEAKHAEVIRVEYDPTIISYGTLLSVFFSTHDPTTLNRQGGDVGTQYRSAIFYTDEQQREDAKKFVKKLEKEKVFENPIVTEIQPLTKFYEAEEYHQEYYKNNKEALYCKVVIDPKIQKLQATYAHLLK